MEYTQNYALRKPGLNEYANVGDLNFNADKIDSQMKKNQDVDGEVYDPTTTSANAYEAGDYVINPDDGLMYVCNGTTYGTWDATKWDHTTEFEEIQKAMASGGESELADLHDVEITNPTDGQALLYDPTSSKWHNSDLPDADVTKEASGNPIEFSDGADAPLVKCVTEIQGSQDLHGYDKPWVGGAGKNKIPFPYDLSEGTYDNIVVTFDDDGTIRLSGTSTTSPTLTVVTIPVTAGRYTLSSVQSSTTTRVQLYKNGTLLISHDNDDRPYSFDIVEGDVLEYKIQILAGSYSNTIIRAMLESGSSATAWTPYSNICPITAYTEGEIEVSDGDGNVTTHTTTYPSAIYRGSEDVVNGEVTNEWKKVVFDGTENWQQASVDRPTCFILDGDLGFASIWGQTLDNGFSNYLVADNESAYAGRGPSFAYVNNRLYVGFPSASSLSDFTTYLSNNNLEICGLLATPTTSSVTPTNLPIKSLSGYNHIESSTGEMEIEYFPQKEQPLIDLIPEASNMHTYSTAEQVVGKWVDGKDVYEKTYVFSSLPRMNDWTAFDEDCGIDTFVDYSLMFTRSNGQIDNDSDELRVAYNPPTGLGDLCYYPGGVGATHITVRYTKTSSNNRSLAKSAPQEEQVEELKEEPEEEVEEVKEVVKEEETKEPETNEEANR